MRWLANLAWIVAGVVIYAICIDVFGGYPQAHSEVLSWLAVVALVGAGLGVWVWHERHGDRD
ncbi:hypothetical protein AB3X52_12960 [Nocardioides sp. DS6]|uniref:DUF2530 domain-containing protein n=1 Tax=Nocardioides eburneus TaxID=3231482 RepID=A0ABV3T3T6_9ACTN